MNKKGQDGAIIAVSVGLIITIVIIGVVFNFIKDSTNYSVIEDEVIAITTGSGLTDNNPVISVEWFGNGTMNTSVATIELNDEVNFTSKGNITVNQNNFTANPNYRIDYTYQPSGYITSTTTRTLMVIVPVLLAIMALVFVVGFVGRK